MKKICYMLSFILFTNSFFAQQDIFTSLLEKKLIDYETKSYPEKVFLHTDKNTYLAGEDIWFSAYLVNGITHKSSNKSLVLHVEFLSPKGNTIAQKKLMITDVQAAGDFKLDKEAKAGIYTIRAYTNYMRNFETTSFFTKKINVIPQTIESKKENTNTIVAATPKNNYNLNKIDKPILEFYPEGGYLVDRLKSKVAVKLIGKGLDTLQPILTILDNTGSKITTFKTYTFGLGFFNLLPDAKKNYTAQLTIADASYSYKLPQVLTRGYTLAVRKKNEELYINAATNHLKGLFGCTVLVHQRGRLVFHTNLKITEKKGLLKIPLSNFSDGVVTVTLFNPERKPVCERLYFVNHINKNITTTMVTKKNYFTKRKKVNVNLYILDSLKKTVDANVSVTVKKINPVDTENTQHTIKTWLLLSSDIKGIIEKPNYFFEKPNDKRREYLLDLLMTTQGWRGFTWQKLLYTNYPNTTYAIEKGITISGKTTDMKTPYANRAAATRISFKGKTVLQEPVKRSNNNGEFSYGPYVFFDTINVFLEARVTNFKSKDKASRNLLIVPKKEIKAPKIVSDITVSNQIDYKKYVQQYKNYLNSLDVNFSKPENVLDEITIKTKLKTQEEKREEEMKERTSYGNAFFRFDVLQNGRSGAVTLLDLFVNSQEVNVNLSEETIRVRNEGTPLILIDESPIFMEDLTFIDAEDISFYDVLIGPQAARFSSNQPVVSIYTKNGNGFSGGKRSPGIIDFELVGFYSAREFYNTNYDDSLENQLKPDLRTTLYWNPKIKTTATPTEFSFFTSDVTTNYKIEVQGITKDGTPIYHTKEIFVE